MTAPDLPTLADATTELAVTLDRAARAGALVSVHCGHTPCACGLCGAADVTCLDCDGEGCPACAGTGGVDGESGVPGPDPIATAALLEAAQLVARAADLLERTRDRLDPAGAAARRAALAAFLERERPDLFAPADP